MMGMRDGTLILTWRLIILSIKKRPSGTFFSLFLFPVLLVFGLIQAADMSCVFTVSLHLTISRTLESKEKLLNLS